MGDIVRRGPKDRPRFYVRYRDADGKRKQRSVKGAVNVAEAKRVLAAIELRIAHGTVGIEQPTEEEQGRRTVTLRALSERFLLEYAPPRLKDPMEYRRQARSVLNVRILPKLGHLAAASITPLMVEQFRDWLIADGFAPNSANSTLGTLSRIYGWAKKLGLIDCTSPVTGCERSKAPSSLDFFSGDEVGQMLAHSVAPIPSLLPMIATAVYSGLRKGELFGLRWMDVALDAARLDVNRSYTLTPKSGKARHLPMHPELVRILREWKKACPPTAEGLVFPVPCRSTGWRMGLRSDSAGLEDLLTGAGCHLPAKPWHALRHTFASHFMMSCGNILTLQKLLGHATLDMTLIYAHLAPDFMANEVAGLNFAQRAPAGVSDLAEARRARVASAKVDTRGTHEATPAT